MYFHGQKFYSFCGKVFNLAGYLSKFFHVPQFEFHGHDFIKISRASLSFHGNFFRVFQSFSRAFSFSRATGFFFHGYDFDFHGKKRLEGSGTLRDTDTLGIITILGTSRSITTHSELDQKF